MSKIGTEKKLFIDSEQLSNLYNNQQFNKFSLSFDEKYMSYKINYDNTKYKFFIITPIS